MAKPRLKIQIGQEYGWLTVKKELPKNASGHYQYLTKCRCGNTRVVTPTILNRGIPKCKKCGLKHGNLKKRNLSVGTKYKSWLILSEEGKNQAGVVMFACQCLFCGNISVKSSSTIQASNGKGCTKCKFNYDFKLFGNKAIGTLPDDTNFIIDSEDIEKVKNYNWVYKDGYIICSNTRMIRIRLHNFIMGVRKTKTYCVDHINRNPLDCRKVNLRIVTLQQNSMNRSIQSNNTSGYVGVIWHKKKQRYFAQVGLNNKNIYLGSSKNKIECAQMYNFASELLFGEFIGHRNEVPEIKDELKQRVYEKCEPYLLQAKKATESLEIAAFLMS